MATEMDRIARPAAREATMRTGRRARSAGSPGRPGFRSWLAQNGLATASIVGAVIYGIARMSYVAYYSAFGVKPEDVGVSYSSVLVEAVPGLLVAVIPIVLVIAVIVVAAVIGLARWGDIRPEKLSWGVGVVGYGTVFLLLVLLVLLPTLAHVEADEVKRGDEVHASTSLLSTATFRNPLALTARRVEIQWIERQGDPPLDLGTRVMLIGSGGDLHYLWDVEKRRTVRLPRNLVILYEDD
jgi:hypothetical protein